MKSGKKSIQSIKFASVAAVSMLMVSLAVPTLAQVTPALEAKAKEACLAKAQEKGFTLDQVAEVAAVDADTVKVVLQLTGSQGEKARLTCRYSAKSSSVLGFGDEAATTGAGTTFSPWFPAWLWLPLSLLGLAGLLAWAKGRGRDGVVAASRTTEEAAYAAAVGRSTEGVIRTAGTIVDVHAGPASTYPVTTTLRNGQQVTLSGRSDNNWVELAAGGWIPVEYLERDPRYVR